MATRPIAWTFYDTLGESPYRIELTWITGEPPEIRQYESHSEWMAALDDLGLVDMSGVQ